MVVVDSTPEDKSVDKAVAREDESVDESVQEWSTTATSEAEGRGLIGFTTRPTWEVDSPAVLSCTYFSRVSLSVAEN